MKGCTVIDVEDRLNSIYWEYSQDRKFDGLRTATDINLVPGVGPIPAKIMLIGEKPGIRENDQRKPFTGRAGSILSDLMSNAGLQLEESFRTNLVKYWPRSVHSPDKGPAKARSLTSTELESSREYVQREINVVDPLIIGLMGHEVIKAFYPEHDQIYSIHGNLLDGIFVPLYHPALIMYREDKREIVQSGFNKLAEYVKSMER